jgi:hypothetical protein
MVVNLNNEVKKLNRMIQALQSEIHTVIYSQKD